MEVKKVSPKRIKQIWQNAARTVNFSSEKLSSEQTLTRVRQKYVKKLTSKALATATEE